MNLLKSRAAWCCLVAMMLLPVSQVFAFAGPAPEGDASSKSYNVGYNLILDEKWTEAIGAFENHLRQFPKSPYADDAQFWICSAQEKQQQLEQALDCYSQFSKKYAKSEWANDAEAHRVQLLHRLKKAGELGITALHEKEDEEVTLAALYALEDLGDPEAVPAIIDFFDRTKNKALRAKIVYVLAEVESPQVLVKLGDIAIKDPDIQVRKNAVYALGDRDEKEAVTALKNIVRSQ